MQIHLCCNGSIVDTILQRFLCGQGHEAVLSSSACELLDNLEKSSRPADLIISDLGMSNRDGLPEISKVHRQYPDIPIVAMMDSPPALSPDEAIACGVHAYLRRPISLRELGLLLFRIFENSARGKSPGGADQQCR